MKNLFLILIIFLFFNKSVYAIGINIDFFKRFSDCFLQDYIEEALNNNHDLKQTNYKLEQYRQDIKNQFALELPELSASSNYLGAHFPRGDGNFLLKQNSYVLPLSVSYEPDFLLKNRDKTKSKEKLFRAQKANQKGVYISLLSDVASAYINILLFDYLIERQLEILKNKTTTLKLNQNKFNFGVIDVVELLEEKKKLQNEKIIYDNLVKNRKTTLFNFASLIGQSPNNYEEIKRGRLEEFEYQETIPDIINSDLIYARPDIVEIENKLKSAKIDILTAKKEFFPSFNITGYLIFDTAGRGNFFSWESSFALLLAGLTQDIFKGGRKLANLRLQKAKYYELVEQYKQADLNAIKEINNALNLIKEDTSIEKNSKKTLEEEQKSFIASKKKIKRGTISKIEFLDDKNSLYQKEAQTASAKAVRLADYITLYKALGGEL